MTCPQFKSTISLAVLGILKEQPPKMKCPLVDVRIFVQSQCPHKIIAVTKYTFMEGTPMIGEAVAHLMIYGCLHYHPFNSLRLAIVLKLQGLPAPAASFLLNIYLYTEGISMITAKDTMSYRVNH